MSELLGRRYEGGGGTISRLHRVVVLHIDWALALAKRNEHHSRRLLLEGQRLLSLQLQFSVHNIRVLCTKAKRARVVKKDYHFM